jgi:hypothetical protein
MSDLTKPNNWTEEETQNVVNVFSWLLREDRKQNPHLYKKENPTEINKEYADKQADNSHPIMSENS